MAEREHIGRLLVTTARAFQMVAEEIFDTDVPFQHLTTLFAINVHPGLSGRALGRESFVNAQSMNESLAWLQQRGYIERRQSPHFANALVANLTVKGRNVITGLMKRSGNVERELSGDLSREELETLRGLLFKARDGIRKRLGMTDDDSASLDSVPRL